jgi:hypothetical protein
MRPYLAFLLTLMAGTAAGLFMTYLASGQTHGLGAIRATPWVAWTKAGSPEADPYDRAIQARSAIVPLGVGEGMALFAETDKDGRPLDGRCVYTIAGRVPSARYWTLALYTPQGMSVETTLQRTAFTSAEIVRFEDGVFAVSLAPEVRPGNWLQTNPGPFVIALRLYDTVLAANAFALDPQTLPTLVRESCP